MTSSTYHSVAKWSGILFLLVIAVLLSLWFVVFKLYTIPYPSNPDYGPEICYSPNHEYYIKRYQSFFQSQIDQLYAEGLAILYDAKTNKELYRGKAYLSEMAGPSWYDDSVGFQGEYDWFVKLPSSPGAHPTRNQGCFKEISTYEAPKVEPVPTRDLIIKAVEPLDVDKTQAPYQMQFLLLDQHNEPHIGFRYLIIRKDNSRVRGETNEQGRSVVVESSSEETVSFFIPPDGGIHEQYSTPEGLIAACPLMPKGALCFDPKDHTFTAKTLKIGP